MPVYLAHYRSPDASAARARGLFEFESESRAGTRANSHDARVRMLELFGNDALSWTIDRIERKQAKAERSDGQLELDFRDPKPERKRRAKREYW